jgi:hypothetical protein
MSMRGRVCVRPVIASERTMPFAALIVVIDILFVIHAAKTGRFTPWGYLILLLPVVGVVAYILVELLPEWFGSAQGQRTRRRVVNSLDPEKEYRKLTDELEVADTIATRTALAEECLDLEKFEEAWRHYDNVLARPLGDEPSYALGKARAEFGLGRPQDTIATLEGLRERWPQFESADGHLLYARALEESGRTAEALDEYQAVANYFAGAEARVRWALLLDKAGRHTEAKRLFAEVLTQMKRAPKYVRKVQAPWIATAERELRS